MDGLAVLVVGEADAGDTHLTHGCFVSAGVFWFGSPAFALAVLMVAHAMDGDVFSIENRPLFGSKRTCRTPKGRETRSTGEDEPFESSTTRRYR